MKCSNLYGATIELCGLPRQIVFYGMDEKNLHL